MTSTSIVFTELANRMKYGGGGGGSYITLFSLNDVTAFHRLKNMGGGGPYITLFSPSDVTAFHRIAINPFEIVHKFVSLIFFLLVCKSVKPKS